MESPDAILEEYRGVDSPTSSDTLALSPLGVAALAYAQQGKPIFPCGPGSKQPLGRLVPNGFKDATTDLDTVRRWWTEAPTANIGMPTGLPATGTVLDVDIKPEQNIQGDATLEGLVALNGELPITLLQRTPSGGMHFCFAYAPGLGNSAGTLGKGLDIRGEGGYIVVAPSILPTGVYTWANDAELAPIPGWITAKLSAKKITKYKVPADAGPGNRNDTLWNLGRSLRATGNDDLSIEDALMARNARFAPPLDNTEVDGIIARVISTADRPDFTPPPAPPSGSSSASTPPSSAKQRIYVTGDLTDMTGKGWLAIVQANTGPSLFQRSTVGVRLERDDDDYLMTKALTDTRLRHELARAADFFVVTRQGEEEVFPPMPIVQDMLATPQLPLPVLDRIVEVPTFTATGQLRTEPGYDPDGRTFYQPPENLIIRPVSDRPTPSEIRDAGALILEVFKEFDVVAPADTAHAVALMLQPFVRELIKGPVPCHVFDAPTPGTGKSLMARAALLPFLGRTVSAMPPARDEEEWRKRIGAKLMQTTPVVFIDNLKTGVSLDSASLAMAITSYPKWEDRRLGFSEVPQVAIRNAWVVTGNNIGMSMEMARRSVRTRQVSSDERPWLRTGWRHDPLEDWILAERPRIIHSCLTLGRAWLAADRPSPGEKTLGMFESWVRVIGGILLVAEIPGFLENIEDLYAEADLESGELREFFSAWLAKHGDTSTTAVTLAMLETGLPAEVLEANNRTAKLGYYLRTIKDKAIKLVKNGPTYVAKPAGKTREGVVAWKLTIKN